jgi:hypothetical protein
LGSKLQPKKQGNLMRYLFLNVNGKWAEGASRCFSFLLIALLMLFTACKGGESPTKPTPPEKTEPSVQAVSGNEQNGVVAMELAQPLVVKVSDSNGEPLSDKTVSWTIATRDGSLSSTSTTTDAEGKAQVTWTLGTKAGEQEVTASISESESKAAFTATAAPGEPVEFVITPEPVSLQTWGDSLQLKASMADEYGNPIQSEPVAWSSSDSDIVSVNENGWAKSYWAARPGEAVLTAQLEGMEATVNAEVIAQANPQCQMSTTFPVQGPVGGVPSFTNGDLVDAPGPQHYDNNAAIGDFDGDGDEDILVFSFNVPWDGTGDQGGEVLFWKNDGTGQFTDATQTGLEPDFIKADHTAMTEVGDFNGDGIPDVYGAQMGYDQPPYPGAPGLLLLSGGDGTLTNKASTKLSPYETSGFTHSSASADVDCDGDIDIYEGDLINGGPHLQINNGNGSFVAEDDRLPARIASQELGYADAEFMDVDRDGDQDFLLGEIGGSGDVLLINDGFGYFRRAPEKALPQPYYTVGNISVRLISGDFNRDGWTDALVSQTEEGYYDGRLAYWRNNGDGTFEDVTSDSLQQPWAGTGISAWSSQLRLADFNGDGWDDLLADEYFLLNQAGTFIDVTGSIYGLHQARPELRAYSTFLPYPIDVDGDGSKDILIIRGWYEHNPYETSPAVILQNMN